MRRTALCIALAAVAAAAHGSLAGPDSAAAQTPSLVGRYALLTRIEQPIPDEVDGNLSIDTYDPTTGAISGHGRAQGLSYTMSGTVSGSSISMRVSAPGAPTAIDLGTIGTDGTISGTITSGSGSSLRSGTWVMIRLYAPVVVEQTGVSTVHDGHRTTVASWGVVLANPSTTRDAVRVTVNVELVGADGKPVRDQGQMAAQTLTVLPALQTFYLGGDDNLSGDVAVRGVRASVTVGSTPPKRYGLPEVSGVHVDASSGEITGTVTNRFSTAISPFDFTADAVLYDRRGRVIGGADLGQVGDLLHLSSIEPGGRAPVTLTAPAGVPASRIGSARVTVFGL